MSDYEHEHRYETYCEDCGAVGYPLQWAEAKVSTLEARIADVEGENQALWNKLDAEIERRVGAEARIAELTADLAARRFAQQCHNCRGTGTVQWDETGSSPTPCPDCNVDRIKEVAAARLRIAELERERDGWRNDWEHTKNAGSALNNECVLLRGQLSAARADRDEAVRLLREMEWIDMRPLSAHRRCPSCLGVETGERHADGCKLAAYLAIHPAQPETPAKGTR